MRSPATAKDDQPGPIGRRHSSTGGDSAQSVAIRTPGMMPSRAGPRKPGQSAPVVAPEGAGGRSAGSLLASASRPFSGGFTAGGADGAAAGVSPGRAAGGSTRVFAAGGDASAAGLAISSG